jgi:hypothetical protein
MILVPMSKNGATPKPRNTPKGLFFSERVVLILPLMLYVDV